MAVMVLEEEHQRRYSWNITMLTGERRKGAASDL